jgi:hypothetical protein
VPSQDENCHGTKPNVRMSGQCPGPMSGFRHRCRRRSSNSGLTSPPRCPQTWQTKRGFRVGQPHVVGPSCGIDHDRMRAAMVAAEHDHPRRANDRISPNVIFCWCCMAGDYSAAGSPPQSTGSRRCRVADHHFAVKRVGTNRLMRPKAGPRFAYPAMCWRQAKRHDHSTDSRSSSTRRGGATDAGEELTTAF